MKKQIILGVYCIFMCLPLVACTNVERVTATVETASVTASNEGKFMEATIISGGSFSAGSETWKKDEKIIFTIKSEEDAKLEIGILPVLVSGDYGEIIGEVCEVGLEEEVISIQVPEDGEYGICFINKGQDNASFQIELNKDLKNPLV